MSIEEVKRELGITDTDIAKFFGYKNRLSYVNSARKKNIEKGIIEIYKTIKNPNKNENN